MYFYFSSCGHSVRLETRAQPQVLLLRSHLLCSEAGSPTESQDSWIRIVWQTSGSQGSSCFCFSVLRLQVHAPMPSFSCGLLKFSALYQLSWIHTRGISLLKPFFCISLCSAILTGITRKQQTWKTQMSKENLSGSRKMLHLSYYKSVCVCLHIQNLVSIQMMYES